MLDPGQDHVTLTALCLLAQRLCMGPPCRTLPLSLFRSSSCPTEGLTYPPCSPGALEFISPKSGL